MEEWDKVHFKFIKVLEDVCSVVTVRAVLKEKKHYDYVSLHSYLLFVKIEDRPMVTTTLRY